MYYFTMGKKKKYRNYKSRLSTESKTFNIKTRNGFSYTQDDVKIYNLYISNISPNINDKDIEDYFSKFFKDHFSYSFYKHDLEKFPKTPIRSIKIAQKRNSGGVFRYGFLCMNYAEHASMILENPYYQIKGKKVKIRPADSWKQPKQQEIDISSNQNYDDTETVFQNSVLNLNDDCLLHIFSFLTINEKLKMSALCQRFEEIFKMDFKINKCVLDVNTINRLTLMEIRQLTAIIGRLVQNVSCTNRMNRTNRRYLEVLPAFTNLKILKLSDITVNIRNDIFQRIAKNLKSIKELEIINCNINDEVCLYLSQLPNIEVLNLSRNDKLTGKYLDRFKNVKKLYLNCLCHVNPTFYVSAFKNLQFLEELEIIQYRLLSKEMTNNLPNLKKLTMTIFNLNPEVINSIVELKGLESLTICGQKFIDLYELFINLSDRKDNKIEELKIFVNLLNERNFQAIKMLTSIKVLWLSKQFKMNDDFLLAIAKWKSLEFLDISACRSITIFGLIQLLKISESIEFVNISSCSQFTEDLIFAAIDVLKPKTRTKPCTLFIKNTSIHPSINENIQVIESKSFLKLDFGIPFLTQRDETFFEFF